MSPQEMAMAPYKRLWRCLSFLGGGVVFGDEDHRKTKLGRATKY